ncbi:MAG: hypothetical protein FWD97_03825 [Defluviitaleaceae bacterium]|nr:hypothetical protein [Defluviitaleaceae bacterium]
MFRLSEHLGPLASPHARHCEQSEAISNGVHTRLLRRFAPRNDEPKI